MATGEEINQLLTELDDKSNVLVTRFTRVTGLIKKIKESDHPLADELIEAFQELIVSNMEYNVASLDAIAILVKSQAPT